MKTQGVGDNSLSYTKVPNQLRDKLSVTFRIPDQWHPIAFQSMHDLKSGRIDLRIVVSDKKETRYIVRKMHTRDLAKLILRVRTYTDDDIQTDEHHWDEVEELEE